MEDGFIGRAGVRKQFGISSENIAILCHYHDFYLPLLVKGIHLFTAGSYMNELFSLQSVKKVLIQDLY